MSNKPWWWPQITDAEWCREQRSDYPELAHKTDEWLRFYFTEDHRVKFYWTWDHLGDAKEQVEKMAELITYSTPE